MVKRKYSVERMRRAFKIYSRLELLEERVIRERPEGHFGIYVHDDDSAVSYQKYIHFRKSKLSCWLGDRRLSYYDALWLTYEEQKKLMQIEKE